MEQAKAIHKELVENGVNLMERKQVIEYLGDNNPLIQKVYGLTKYGIEENEFPRFNLKSELNVVIPEDLMRNMECHVTTILISKSDIQTF